MRITGRRPGEYFTALRGFFAALVILAGVSVVARLTGRFVVLVQYLPLAGVPLIGWAGWHAVRNREFNLWQTAIAGFILSFGSHWTLPIFHSAGEGIVLFVVNSSVFIAFALAGGILARTVRFR